MNARNDRVLEFSSFRDPSGIVFSDNNVIYRQINGCYAKQYSHLMQSGLYDSLVNSHMLVSHREVNQEFVSNDGICVISPEQIPLISYPYEWSFSALRDSALLTLQIHRKALDFGMVLKDASAYNIQFLKGNPILIDTLSFDFYRDGDPWLAYGQFCRHFLAPLLLMCYVDMRLNRLLNLFIDGIPLDLTDKLLKGKGGFFARQHIHWHSKFISKHSEDGKAPGSIKTVKISKKNQIALIESMIIGIERLKLPKTVTEWGNYNTVTSYTEAGAVSKKEIIKDYLGRIKPDLVWDFGANDGIYSRLALGFNSLVAAFDADPIAVERNYSIASRKNLPMLSLLMDLTNPSPGIGFANLERTAINGRQKPDCIMMLAVVHHLAISNNVPFQKLAEWLGSLCRYLIIEFVPKIDPQVQLLLAGRVDIFNNYSEEGFENAFGKKFLKLQKNEIKDSGRVLYLYERK